MSQTPGRQRAAAWTFIGFWFGKLPVNPEQYKAFANLPCKGLGVLRVSMLVFCLTAQKGPRRDFLRARHVFARHKWVYDRRGRGGSVESTDPTKGTFLYVFLSFLCIISFLSSFLAFLLYFFLSCLFPVSTRGFPAMLHAFAVVLRKLKPVYFAPREHLVALGPGADGSCGSFYFSASSASYSSPSPSPSFYYCCCCLFVYSIVCLMVCLFVGLLVCWFVGLLVCVFVCLFVCVFVWLFVCLLCCLIVVVDCCCG